MINLRNLIHKRPRRLLAVAAATVIPMGFAATWVGLMALQGNGAYDSTVTSNEPTTSSGADKPKKRTPTDSSKPADGKQEPKKTAKKPASKPVPESPATPAPTPVPKPAPSSEGLQWPTPQTTGPRVTNFTTYSGTMQSTRDGQVISGYSVTGRLVIRHNNVTVRDTRIYGTGTYMLEIERTGAGSCPSNARIEHVEIDGHLGADNYIPIYGNGCGFVFDRGYVHRVGRSSRIQNNATVSNSYIHSSLTGDSGAHRGAVGINGGSNNVIFNNVLKCSGAGCSAAIPNYGDFAPVTNLRIEHNLLATTGSYCAYGGSLSSKPYPEGSNIDFINNHFSTEFFPTCGRYGVISGFASGVRGNDWIGNVWHESGAAIPAP